jgi:hypothetical protein
MNRLVGLLFLTVLLAGCPHRIDFGGKGEIKDVGDLLRSTAYAEAQVVSVKGEAKIKVDSPQNKGVVTLFMAVTHPALIHLESLNFFGKPQAVLVSDGQTFGLFAADEGKYYRGPASPQNISRFLPVVLPPEELTALMLGRAPRIPADAQAMRVDETLKAYVVTLQRGNVEQTLTIHPSNHRVLKSQVRGVSAYDLEFENIETVGQVTYPRKVVLTAPAASTTLELLYKDVAVNEAPDLTMFDQEPPANVPIVEVDENGKPRQAPAP